MTTDDALRATIHAAHTATKTRVNALFAALRPAVTAIGQWAQTPEGQAAIAQMRRDRDREPCACICSITHPSTTPGHDGPATRTLNRTTETLGRVPIPMCQACAHAALAAQEAQ